MLEPADPLYELASLTSAVTVMPFKRNGDKGVYTNESLSLVKELRSSGIDASFLDRPEHREWRVLLGADVVQEFVIGFVTSIAATATWVGLGALLRKNVGNSKASVQIVELESSSKGLRAEWFKVEGDGPTIEAALIQRGRLKQGVKGGLKGKRRPKSK